MDSNTRQQLEKARSHVFAWRMLDAYNIYRRYFDRLPFQAEKEHADHVGYFVRCLFELGKEFELKFYLTELEKLYERQRSPHITYTLGVVYSYSGSLNEEASKKLFEQIVRDPNARAYHPKSKMMLADYYLKHDDVLACRMLIDSIEVPPGDELMQRLVTIWKGVCARREKRYADARVILETLIRTTDINEDWYSYFSAKVVLAMVYIDSGDMTNATSTVAEVRELFAGRRLKLVQHQLEMLENLIKEKSGPGRVRCLVGETESKVIYADKTLCLKNKSPSEKLLLLLMKKGFVDKAFIVKALYGRQYEADQDDKLVYYHVHSLRKRLKTVGLQSDAIVSEGAGYRFVPDVDLVGEEDL